MRIILILLTIIGSDADSYLDVPSILHLNITDSFNASITNFITLDHLLNNPENASNKKAGVDGGIGLGILFRAINNISEIINVSFINATLVNAKNGSEAGTLTFYTANVSGIETRLVPRLILNGSDVFIAPTGGKVGIGTTSPTQKLDIQSGQLRIRNNVLGLSPSSDFVIQNVNSNSMTSVRVSPKGSPSGIKSNFQFFNTDWVADQTNYEAGEIRWNNNLFEFNVNQGGSGIQRPMVFSIGNAEKVRIDTTGNVGIGTTDTKNALDVVGAVAVSKGLNASNLNVTGFSITDDSLVTVIEFDDNIPQEAELRGISSHIPNFSYTPENRKYSGLFSNVKKIKIKDIKAGDYVLSLEEKTGKLVPRKVNALLDHGIKPIYEMATEDGRAINTTAEHLYYVKSFLPDKILNASEGVITLSGNAFFNPLSPENIGQLKARDKATYGASLSCGANCLASGKNCRNSPTEIKIISSIKNSYASSNSCSDNLVNLSAFDLCFLTSSSKNSGATNSNLFNIAFNEKTEAGTPLIIREEITTFASTTNFSGIIHPLLLESNLSYLLANDSLTSSASSWACSSLNFDLDTIFLNLTTFKSLSFNTLFTSMDNSSFGIALNSDSNSSGILIINSDILQSPSSNNENNYLKVSDAKLLRF